MRVLLLTGLAALANAAHHEVQKCGTECIGKIFEEAAKAEDMGFTAGDASAYAFLLHKGFQAAGEAGALWVKAAVEQIGGENMCNCGDTCNATKLKDCLNDATADQVKEFDDALTALDISDEEKEGFKWILGSVANQIAPGSEPTKTYTTKITSEEFAVASKVYNIVGAFTYFIVPTIEAAYGADTAETNACYAAIFAAIDFTEGTDDLALKIGENGEDAFGDDGLGSDACFGSGSTATDISVTFAGAGRFAETDSGAQTFAAPADVMTAAAARLETANDAIAAETKANAEKDAEETSPAAVLSAAIAAIALML